MKLKLKENVQINGGHFESEILKIIEVARNTCPPTKDNYVWITSANDSKHKPGSKHYENKALDFRIINLKGEVKRLANVWASEMQLHLGNNYDVVLEYDHIHVEYDPK